MQGLRKSILLAAFVLPIGSLAFAQDDGMGTPDAPEGEKEAKKAKKSEKKAERKRGQNERRARRGMGRMGLPVDEMKEELGLNDEQVAAFEAMNADIREQMKGMREKFQDPNFDPSTLRETFQNRRKEMQAKVDEILTPEQREKYESMRRNRQRGGQNGRRGGGRSREQLGARLKENALKTLALSEEESAVIVPLLDGVLETQKLLQQEQDRRRQEFLKKVREGAVGDELAKLLGDYRASRAADRETVVAAQTQLREILTLEQEAAMVGMNILD